MDAFAIAKLNGPTAAPTVVISHRARHPTRLCGVRRGRGRGGRACGEDRGHKQCGERADDTHIIWEPWLPQAARHRAWAFAARLEIADLYAEYSRTSWTE